MIPRGKVVSLRHGESRWVNMHLDEGFKSKQEVPCHGVFEKMISPVLSALFSIFCHDWGLYLVAEMGR